MRATVLLLAAGGGQRLGREVPKAFIDVAGVPMIKRSADAACAADLVDALVAVVPGGHVAEARSMLIDCSKPVEVVAGGATRQASAALGLAAVGDAEAVLVHDAARPLCPTWMFDAALEMLDHHEAVICATPVWDTLKRVDGSTIRGTVDRRDMVAAQTPQAFRAEVYRKAHAEATADVTDDAGLVEAIGVPVAYTLGHPHNIKITSQLDLELAEALCG